MDLIRKLTKEYEGYLFDESRTMGRAEWIAFPQSEEELCAAVRWCHENHVPLTAQGGMTGLAGGASPNGGLALNLSRMNRILGLRRDEAGVYYLRVQPGLLLTQLRKALANKAFDLNGWSEESIETLRDVKAGSLFFSPDPTEPTASLGGMASCNACGARSFLYGCTRAHIQKLRVVLADGRVCALERGKQRAQGRAVTLHTEDGGELHTTLPSFDTPDIKDAGFMIRENMELIDLFMGSQGVLGVISELELILRPAPKHLWGVTAFFPDDENALAYVRALKTSAEVRPSAIEFFNRNALDMVVRQKEITPAFRQLLPLPQNYNCGVYAEFVGDDPSQMYAALQVLSQLVTRAGGDPKHSWVARDEMELEKLLFFRHTVPETIDLIIEENKKRESCITILSTDMAVDDAHFDELFHIYKHDLEATTLHWVIFGHIGENHVHPNILARTREEYEQGHAIFEKWARDVHRMGGSISAEHGAGKIKRKLALIMYGPERMRELVALKRSLDPQQLLGPGNILTLDA